MKQTFIAKVYSWIVLVFTVAFETTTIIGIRSQNNDLWIKSLSLLLLLSFIVILTAYLCNNILFLPNKKIFTKLMSNAIAPNWLGAFYLLLFVVHIGWLTDGSLNYFQTSNDNFMPVTASLSTGLIGMIVLICFFPEGKPNKEEAKHVVLVSGISLLAKDKQKIILNKKEYTKALLYNVGGLVKVFSLCFDKKKVKSTNVNKLLILNSNAHYQADFFKNLVVEICVKKDQQYEWEQFLGNGLNVTFQTIDSGSEDSVVIYVIIDNSALVDDNLRTIIKIRGLQDFPNEREFFTNLQIDFTPPCDYDNFEQCFRELNDSIKIEDTPDQLLYFNLTPGTGIVGSLMTLFSLDKYRELYFYAQFSSKELLPVDKSKVPLENLLSQALEL